MQRRKFMQQSLMAGASLLAAAGTSAKVANDNPASYNC